MNFINTYNTITSSKVFKEFIKEHEDAELVAGFFILDLLENNNQKSLDYKSNGKIFTFSLNENNEITLREDELIQSDKPLLKISANIKIDLDEIPSIAENQAERYNIMARFQKIIAVLQNYENKEIWNLTCMLDGLIILNILIDSETGEIVKFERKSMADFIKKV